MQPFAMLAQSSARSVLSRLADCELVVNGGASIPAIFSDAPMRAPDMLDGSMPTATVGADAYPGLQRGDRVARGAIVYEVIGIEPDGVGLTVLRLQRAD